MNSTAKERWLFKWNNLTVFTASFLKKNTAFVIRVKSQNGTINAKF